MYVCEYILVFKHSYIRTNEKHNESTVQPQ